MRNLDEKVAGSGIDDRMNFRFVFVRDLYYCYRIGMMNPKVNPVRKGRALTPPSIRS
jgi:hypothetical protein